LNPLLTIKALDKASILAAQGRTISAITEASHEASGIRSERSSAAPATTPADVPATDHVEDDVFESQSRSRSESESSRQDQAPATNSDPVQAEAKSDKSGSPPLPESVVESRPESPATQAQPVVETSVVNVSSSVLSSPTFIPDVSPVAPPLAVSIATPVARCDDSIIAAPDNTSPGQVSPSIMPVINQPRHRSVSARPSGSCTLLVRTSHVLPCCVYKTVAVSPSMIAADLRMPFL
jgi:hypothetical protein